TNFKSVRNAAATLIAIIAGTITAFADAPANDNFANATFLGNAAATRITNTNEGATKETGEPDHGFNAGGSSVWYKWTASSRRLTQFSTVGSSFNTLLHVYTGSSVDNLTAVSGSNDVSFATLQSFASFFPEPGVTYYIAVDGVKIGSLPAETGLIKLNIGPAINRSSTDFDRDGRTDLTVYRPSDGNWYAYESSTDQASILKWGIDGDIPVSGALLNFGLVADNIIYRPSTGVWYIRYRNQPNNPVAILQFGLPGDIPMTGSFIEGVLPDLAVFRPSNGTWYYRTIPSPAGSLGGEPIPPDPNFGQVQFGQAGDIPVAGDYTNDEMTDFAVYRPSTGVWYILPHLPNGMTGAPRQVQFGIPGDKPVPGDYDGDGLIDPAIYRPSTGTFWVLRSSDNAQHPIRWGLATDIPAAGDYDGDGIFDFAVFRPSDGNWYIYHSGSQQIRIQHFGLNGDIPVTSNVR
ncbi:MAG TPA: VCBS repeat-containing protein, partial [Pyrinomonadaceae bacterium]|nr:VCBS repeat-containing protein [Pyrinomonadaceae bacterium]